MTKLVLKLLLVLALLYVQFFCWAVFWRFGVIAWWVDNDNCEDMLLTFDPDANINTLDGFIKCNIAYGIVFIIIAFKVVIDMLFLGMLTIPGFVICMIIGAMVS